MTSWTRRRTTRASERAGLFVIATTLAFAVGCGGGDPRSDAPPSAPPSEVTPGEKTGSVSFALTTGDLTFYEFSYAITGPNFSKAGSIDVSDSTTVSALITGIPAGTGYSITLMGTSVAPYSTCSGSATFAVAEGATTNVPVSVACHVDDPRPAAVPIPPFAPVALGFVLFALGAFSAARRRRPSIE